MEYASRVVSPENYLYLRCDVDPLLIVHATMEGNYERTDDSA
jgi:hypothetical protein